MNPRKRNLVVLAVATIVVLGFGLYAWLNQNSNSRDTSLTVTVTLSSHVVDQGSSLELYLNASRFNAAYSIDGTLESGLIIVPTYENGTQIGGDSAIVHYSLSQNQNRVKVFWNLTSGNYGYGVGTENWLLSAGFYKVTEGGQIANLPSYVSDYTFNIVNPVFQIKGIGYSVSHNNRNVSLKVNSSIASTILSSVNLTVSNTITNTTTHVQTYSNFSRNLNVPDNLTLSYRLSSQSTQFTTTIYLKTDLGTIMGVESYGIFP